MTVLWGVLVVWALMVILVFAFLKAGPQEKHSLWRDVKLFLFLFFFPIILLFEGICAFLGFKVRFSGT